MVNGQRDRDRGVLSLSQLLQHRLKSVFSEMPLGGVMEQSPPVGSIAVEKILNITISLNPYTIWTINRVRRKKCMRHTATQFLAITGSERFKIDL